MSNISLDSDVLAEIFIFTHSIVGPPITPVLAQVSRTWRAAALSTTRLWATIDIDLARPSLEDLSRSQARSGSIVDAGIDFYVPARAVAICPLAGGLTSLPRLETWLERSGPTAPLSIVLRWSTPLLQCEERQRSSAAQSYVRIDIADPTPSRKPFPFYHQALCMIEQYRERWKSLRFDDYTDTAFDISSAHYVTSAFLPLAAFIERLVRGDLPQLTDLHVPYPKHPARHRFTDFSRILFDDHLHLPSLTCVTVGQDGLVPVLTKCPSLRYLQLNMELIPLVFEPDHLRSSVANIRTLSILASDNPGRHRHELKLQPERNSRNEPTLVDLPFLTELNIPFTNISWLRCPALATLRIVVPRDSPAVNTRRGEENYLPMESAWTFADRLLLRNHPDVGGYYASRQAGTSLRNLHLANVVIIPAVALQLLSGIPSLWLLHVECVTCPTLWKLLTTTMNCTPGDDTAADSAVWLVPNLRELHVWRQPMKGYVVAKMREARCTGRWHCYVDGSVDAKVNPPARLLSLTWDGIEHLEKRRHL